MSSESQRTPGARQRSRAELAPESLGTAPPRGRLAGRRVLVVGAGTRPSDDPHAPPGNGRAIAILCAREGARVACADMSEEAAQSTTAAIRSQGGEAEAILCDVRSESDCERTVHEAVDRLGGLDGIVLNVGVGDSRSVEETGREQWDDSFAANVRGHFLVLRAATPLLKRGDSVVFVSSTAALAPSFGAAYSASKAAVEGLCRQYASANAGDGIRANAVSPCAVDTPLGREYARRSGLESLDELGLPMRRAGTAWEVAYAAVFLLSDEAAYTTGHTLFVDGGFMVNGAHRAPGRQEAR